MSDQRLAFARKFHARSTWKDAPFDDDAVLAFIANLEANAYFKITERGMIGGMIVPLWFAPSMSVAAEMFWYSEETGEGRRLREGFEQWASENGAPFVLFSMMTHDREPVVRRIYERAGYDLHELAFRKRVA